MFREHLEGNYIFVSTAILCYSTALFISMHDMKDNYIFYSIQKQFPHLETEAAQGCYPKFPTLTGTMAPAGKYKEMARRKECVILPSN